MNYMIFLLLVIFILIFIVPIVNKTINKTFFMDYIRYQFVVALSNSPFIGSFEKDNEQVSFPFKGISITPSEIHICPFCGKTVSDLSCDCEEFRNALTKLQNSFCDEKHESSLLNDPKRFPITCAKVFKASDFTINELTKDQIADLGFDYWDDASKFTDQVSDVSFFVTDAVLENESLVFSLKNLKTKKVYKFMTDKIDYENVKIVLGIYFRKTVSDGHSNRLGNYHFVDDYKILGKFESWDDVCSALKRY